MLDDASSRRTQDLLRQLLDGTEAGVVVFDPELCFQYVNPTLARMNGLAAADHIGRPVREVLPGLDAREDILRQILADGIPREITSSGHTLAGSDRPRRFWHAAYHRIEEDGRVVGLVGILVEVTEAHEQQRNLERARARLAVLDQAATVIGTTLDMDTTCQELAAFLVPELADAATVEVFPHEADPGARPVPAGTLRLRRAGLAAVPGLLARVRSFGEPGTYVDYQPGSSIQRCLESGRPMVDNVFTDAELSRSAPNPDRVAAYRASGLHSALVVPLSCRDKPVGTVTLLRADDSPAFDADDVATAQDLARRAAIALDNARRYTAEHHIALELQQALLAAPGRPHPGLDIATRYLPSGASALVGGDWFDAIALPQGRTLLVIGDVMGHGVQAAVDMSHYNSMLKVIARQQPAPHLILDTLDALMTEAAAERPATCLLVLADPVRGECTYASAGHLPPFLIEADGSNRLLHLPTGPPLGVGRGGHTSVTVPCGPGRTLLLYTDGLIERRGEDIDVSLDRLNTLRPLPGAALTEILDHVLHTLTPPGTVTEDDIAILAARFRASD
ncbi:SpoIIE family protein phosphatase [Kitasatospora sp. NPDC101801]|uniref:SpoIIE family protein phosphatase n=1 Tax=Kitasatospora sp. NPDC101801 TaxID=3364103 RepID=UPI00381AFEFC